MSSSEFFQQLINAVSLGSIYALVAIGLAMVFSILRLINFAHGEVLMLGAFATFFWARTGLPFVFVAILAVATTVVIGILMERIAYRPVRGAPDVALLLTSLGVSIAVQNTALLAFGEQPRRFPTPTSFDQRLDLGGSVSISVTNLVTVLIAVAVVAPARPDLLRHSHPLGVSMRAAAENPSTAQLMGINTTPSSSPPSSSGRRWPGWQPYSTAPASAGSIH